MSKSKIEWTDKTWNPVRGCAKVSTGCKNCYAEVMGARFSGKGQPYEGVISGKRWNGKATFHPTKLDEPLRWRKPAKVFVNSMSDLFHSDLSFEQIAAVFGVMAAAGRHTFQVLTKRPTRMLDFFGWLDGMAKQSSHGHIIQSYALDAGVNYKRLGAVNEQWPLPNVWLGVSTEDQKAADERIPLLLMAPAAIRWISAEPLLGPLDVRKWVDECVPACEACGNVNVWGDTWFGNPTCSACRKPLHGACKHLIGWVVVGGESGPSARPMSPSWVRRIMEDCEPSGVFLFKQWGEWGPTPSSKKGLRVASLNEETGRMVEMQAGGGGFRDLNPKTTVYRASKKANGRELDGVIYDRYPNQ